VIRFAKLFAVIFSTAHWLCCAWYAVGDNAYDGEDGRKLQLDAEGEPLMGWVNEKFSGNASGATALHRYGTSFFWSINAVMMVDAGDELVRPALPWEQVMYVVSMLAGGLVSGLLTGSITDMIANSNPGEKARKEALGQVHAFLHEQKITPMVTKKVRAFFAARYHFAGTTFNHRQFFDALPRTLRLELAVALHYIPNPNATVQSSILHQIHFFNHLDPDDKIRICCRLNHVQVRPPEFTTAGMPNVDAYIMQEGDRGTEMWIIMEVGPRTSLTLTLIAQHHGGQPHPGSQSRPRDRRAMSRTALRAPRRGDRVWSGSSAARPVRTSSWTAKTKRRSTSTATSAKFSRRGAPSRSVS
jgi:hypothetical protein